MILALDMDGPIVDLHGYWLNLYNNDYNDNLTVGQVKEWDMTRLVKPECGVKIYDYFTMHGFFRHAPPVAGAVEAVRELNSLHRVYLVTSCPPGPGLEEKCQWVAEHLPFLRQGQIVIMEDKFRFEADVLVDDAPHNLKPWRRVPVIWDMPYNRGLAGLRATGATGREKWWCVQRILKGVGC